MQCKKRRATPQHIRDRCVQLGLDVEVIRNGDHKVRYVFTQPNGHVAFVCGTASADRFVDGYTFASLTPIAVERSTNSSDTVSIK